MQNEYITTNITIYSLFVVFKSSQSQFELRYKAAQLALDDGTATE